MAKSNNNGDKPKRTTPAKKPGQPQAAARVRSKVPHEKSSPEPRNPNPATEKSSPEPGNPGPATEQMEVHHHPDLDHKPKPWKEYLLEGLMIFIAVFLGFIAENVREAITDNQHVRELTSQLVRDLKVDTAQLNEIYNGETEILKANDTLIEILKQPVKKEDIGKIEKLVVASHDRWLFHPSAGAITAIKNELHLKQFSSSRIIGYIAEYEKHTTRLYAVQDITEQYQRSFIDPFLLQHFTAAGLEMAFNRKASTAPDTRNLSQEDFTQLGADMILIRINTNELLTNGRKPKMTPSPYCNI